MSAAYLQQCGEDSVNRQSGSIGMSLDEYGTLTFIGDDVVDSTSLGIPPILGWHRATLAREMDPGWWLFEVIHDIGSAANRSLWVTSFWTADDINSPPILEHVIAGQSPLYKPSIPVDEFPGTLLIKYTDCHRVLFELNIDSIGFPAAGSTFSATLTMTRLACPNCPSPI